MSLADTFAAISAGFKKQASPEALDLMHRTTAELAASGILDGIPKPGDALPPFDLTDTNRHAVSSSDLLAKGPLVMTFYRGVW